MAYAAASQQPGGGQVGLGLIRVRVRGRLGVGAGRGRAGAGAGGRGRARARARVRGNLSGEILAQVRTCHVRIRLGVRVRGLGHG